MTGVAINVKLNSINVPYKQVDGVLQLADMVRHTHLIIKNNPKL